MKIKVETEVPDGNTCVKENGFLCRFNYHDEWEERNISGSCLLFAIELSEFKKCQQCIKCSKRNKMIEHISRWLMNSNELLLLISIILSVLFMLSIILVVISTELLACKYGI